jgi:hypothetical protein
MLASWAQYVILKFPFEEYESTPVYKWMEQFQYIWLYLINIDLAMIVATEDWKLKLHELYELYMRTFNSFMFYWSLKVKGIENIIP